MKPNKLHAPLKRLVIASANPGKLREFRELLAGLPFDPVSQSSIGVSSAEETGTTFMENALLKARHAAAQTASSAIADDSGLEVDALGGAPGIFSARFAGPQADDAANNAKLLRALAGMPMSKRTARYRCALIYVEGPDDPAPVSAEGVWEGVVLEAPRGTGGFGYDPYFWLPELGASVAELDPQDKNRRSHRGCALRLLRERLAARPCAGVRP